MSDLVVIIFEFGMLRKGVVIYGLVEWFCLISVICELCWCVC